MPLIEEQPVVLGQTGRIPEERKGFEPSTLDTFAAAFRVENTLSSAIFRESVPESGAIDPNYDPFNDIAGTRFEDHADSFTEVYTPQQAEAVKRNIDRELKDREVLAASGGEGILASIVAGTVDPVTLLSFYIPGGQVTRLKPLASAVNLGGHAAVGAALTETGLQATQETRTATESGLAVGAGFLVGGTLGGGAAALLGKKGVDELTERVAKDIETMETNLSAGAAATRKGEFKLAGSFGFAETFGRVSPLVRTLNSQSVEARRAAVDLAESAFFFAGDETVPTAVETLVKQYDGVIAKAYTDSKTAYSAYRQRVKGETRLTPRQFREEVGRALRRRDTSDIPEVAQAAKQMRQTIDSLKNKAIELKLLPEDVKAVGAPSYFTRVYNIPKIKQEPAKFVEIVKDWLVKEGVDSAEAADVAWDVVRNIKGHPEGLIPRDIVPKAGPLKERTLRIPDELIEDYLESDVDMVMSYYVRTMAPEIELTRRFGSKDMQEAIDRINQEYKVLAEKNPAKAGKLAKENERVVRDMMGMRDRLLGTYGRPADPDQFIVKASRVTRQVNYLRLLGGMTLSAIPDIARPVMVHGLRRWGGAAVRLARSPKQFKLAMQEAKATGTALDMIMNTRAASLADIGDMYGASRVTKAMESMSSAFSIATLMAPWNAVMKQFSGVMVADRILRATKSLARGDKKKLRQLGIDDAMLQRIGAQFRKYGEDGDLLLSRADQWDDREAAELFQAAVMKDVDSVIITPGVGDRPLMMSSELGKVVGQFKSFAFAATNRALIPALQQRDIAALNGTLLTLALGSLVYGIKNTVAGYPVSDEPGKVLAEAIDRSGLTGYMMDVNNILELATRGTVGLSALTGQGTMSRYASRNILGALFGPTVGTLQDVTQITGAAFSGDITSKDFHKARSMVPFQNVFYARWLFDRMEEKAVEELGIPE